MRRRIPSNPTATALPRPLRRAAFLLVATLALLVAVQPDGRSGVSEVLSRAVDRSGPWVAAIASGEPEVRTPGRWGASVDAFLAEDRAHPPVPGGVVVIGSSSVRLWRLDRAFPESRIVMRGFGGSELADSARLAATLVGPHRPRTVLVYAGENDLAGGASPHEVLARYDALVHQVHAALPRARVVFLSIKPSPSRAGLLPAVRQANALIAERARTDPRLDFVDVHSRMLDAEGRPDAALFQPDRLHLNDAGYRIWDAAVAPHVL